MQRVAVRVSRGAEPVRVRVPYYRVKGGRGRKRKGLYPTLGLRHRRRRRVTRPQHQARLEVVDILEPLEPTDRTRHVDLGTIPVKYVAGTGPADAFETHGVSYTPAETHLDVVDDPLHGVGSDRWCWASKTGTPLDVKTVRSIAYRYARRARAVQQAGRVPLGPSVHGRRVVVSLDGGRLRVRRKKRGPRTRKNRPRYHTDWREPKLLIFYVVDPDGRPSQQWAPIIDGTLKGRTGWPGQGGAVCGHD